MKKGIVRFCLVFSILAISILYQTQNLNAKISEGSYKSLVITDSQFKEIVNYGISIQPKYNKDTVENMIYQKMLTYSNSNKKNNVVVSYGSGSGSGSGAKYFGTPNGAELMLAALHPNETGIVLAAKDISSSSADVLYKNNGLLNGRGDAYRHAYWMALVASETSYDMAMKFGDAHENYPGNPPLEKEMDLHNNRMGAKQGDKARTLGISYRQPKGLQTVETCGGLRVIVGNQLSYSGTSSTRNACDF